METLKRGDTGALVEMMQLALLRAGYYPLAPDGIFGSRTETSLRRFQQNFRLTADGILDSDTWKTLNRFIKGYFTKRVEKGESFWQIAANYGTTLSSLLAANPETDPNRLQIGQLITVPFRFSVTPDDISYSFELISLITDGLQARYPFLSLSAFGSSEMGKPLPLLTIGRGEKELLIAVCFHANEWLNIPAVLTFAETYLAAIVAGGKIEGADAGNLYNRTKLYIAPVVNPDGLDLVTAALQNGTVFENAFSIARNYPAIPFPQGWKANITGTDLNLQFPANWEKAKELKYAQGFISPAPRDYVGAAPLTAPEARAVYSLTNQHDFRMILAYHSQGNIIYWKYLDYLPPDSRRIGEQLSIASGYPLELTPEDSSYAGYKDWYIAQFNRPGYTIETGSGTNPLPIGEIRNIYAANRPLIAAALRETATL